MNAAGAAAAAAAATAAAIKASGAIVQVEPGEFMAIVRKADDPLVVVAYGGTFRKYYRYLTGYKGLVFYAKSKEQLVLPPRIEIMTAQKIWVPEL